MYSTLLLLAIGLLVLGSLNAERGGWGNNDDHYGGGGGRPESYYNHGGSGRPPRPPRQPGFVGFFQTNPARDPQLNTYRVYVAAYNNAELVNEVINLNISRPNATLFSLVESVNSTGVVLQNVTFQLGVVAQGSLLGATVPVTAVSFGGQLILSYNQTANAIGLKDFIFTGSPEKFVPAVAVYAATDAVGNFTGSRQFSRQ